MNPSKLLSIATIFGLLAACVLPVPASLSSGNVVFEFEGFSSARALSPKVYDVIDHVHAVMTPASGSPLEGDILPEVAQKSSLVLMKGTDWVVDFTAITTTSAVVASAQATVTADELAQGGVVKLVSLRPSKTGKGTFQVDFWFPQDGSSTPDFSVKRFPDSSPTSLTTYSGLSDTGGVFSEWTDQAGHDLTASGYSYDASAGKARFSGTLPSGTYQFLLSLGAPTNEIYSGVVNIFDGLRTSGTISNVSRLVQFSPEEGSGPVDDLSISYGTTLNLPANPASRSGWLGGWNTASNLGGLFYLGGAPYTMSSMSDVTLYSDWRAQLTYTSGLGTGTSRTDLWAEGVTSNLGTMSGMSRSGYTFSGWNTALNGSGTAYADGASFTMGAGGSLTLYARWRSQFLNQLNFGTSTSRPVWGVGDINNDGINDIVSYDGLNSATSIKVYKQAPLGTFTNVQNLDTNINGTQRDIYGGTVADLNGDGFAEYISAGPNGVADSNNSVFSNTAGTFATTGTTTNASNGVFFYGFNVMTGQLNSGTNTDVVWFGASTIYTGLGNGAGGFSSIPSVSVTGSGSEVTGTAIADMDNDGDFDLVASRTYNGLGEGSLNVWQNNGSGAFTLAKNFVKADGGAGFTGTFNPRGLAIGDFDRDGKNDLVFWNSSNSDSTEGLWIGIRTSSNGSVPTFNFQMANVPELGTGYANWLSVADWDGDGWLDILVSKNDLSLLTNDGTLGTSFSRIQLNANASSQAVFADMNNDGLLDIVADTGSPKKIYVFYQ